MGYISNLVARKRLISDICGNPNILNDAFPGAALTAV